LSLFLFKLTFSERGLTVYSFLLTLGFQNLYIIHSLDFFFVSDIYQFFYFWEVFLLVLIRKETKPQHLWF